MDKTDKFTFRTLLLLVFVIITSTLIIFILTPSPASPTKQYFGYIKGIYMDGDTMKMEFDRALWFTDEEKRLNASEACVKDGKCQDCSKPIRKSCVPNGYYIRNTDHITVTYSVAPFTKVQTLILNPDWNQENPESKPYQVIDVNQLFSMYTDIASPEAWIASAPYDITVLNGWTIVINQHNIILK